MNEYNYSTEYVSGMTKIPARTIGDYVSAFREFFSAKAGQTVKGRRFLPADIDRLQIIQRLRAERTPDAEIKQLLAGELPFKLAHQFSEAEVKNMAAHSLEIYEQAMTLFEKAEEKIAESRRTMREAQELQKQVRLEMQATRNQISNVRETVQKFREWQMFVMKYDPELNPYKQDDPGEPLAQEMPREKKRSWLGGLNV